MAKKMFALIIFFIVISLTFSEDFIKGKILIQNTEGKAVENTSIHIGDLTLYTNEDGIIAYSLFPTLYEIEVEKENYFTLKTVIDVSESNKDFVFKIETKVLNIDVKVIDSLTLLPLSSSLKITNTDTNNSNFISSDSSGLFQIPLEKNTNYLFEIEENGYEVFTFKLNTSKLYSSDLLFKLKRLESKIEFSFNVNRGQVAFKFYESKNLYNVINFENGTLLTQIPYGKYDVSILAPEYKTFSKTINVNVTNFSESYILTPNYKTFSINLFYSNKEKFEFHKDLHIDSYIPLKGQTTLVFYKNQTVIKKISTDKSVIKENLVYDLYDVEIKNDFSEKYIIKNLNINETLESNILINLIQLFAKLEGTVKVNNALIGGAKINFTDNFENVYSTFTEIDGKYMIKLPPIDYSFSVLKDGFRIKSPVNTSIKELKPDNSYKIDIELEEIPSVLKGRIVSLSNSPINNATITFKVDKEEIVTTTNEAGEYTAYIKSGLVFIKVDKKGFKSKGTIKNVSKFSTLTGIDFKLEQVFSNVKGTVTDGRKAVKNILIKIVNQNEKEIAKVSTRDSGNFVFESLPILEKFYLVIEPEKAYMKFKSQPFMLNSNSDYVTNIILKKNSLKVIIELKNENNEPIKEEKITFLEKETVSDINGIAELELEYSKIIDENGDYKFEIIIPNKNHKESIELKKDVSLPYKKEIILKANPSTSSE